MMDISRIPGARTLLLQARRGMKASDGEGNNFYPRPMPDPQKGKT